MVKRTSLVWLPVSWALIPSSSTHTHKIKMNLFTPPLPQLLRSSGTRGGRGDRPLPHSLRPRAEPRLRARPLPLPSPPRPAGLLGCWGTQPCYRWESAHILSVGLRQGEGRQPASGDHSHHVGSLPSFSLRCTFLALATLLLCPSRPVPLPL